MRWSSKGRAAKWLAVGNVLDLPGGGACTVSCARAIKPLGRVRAANSTLLPGDTLPPARHLQNYHDSDGWMPLETIPLACHFSRFFLFRELGGDGRALVGSSIRAYHSVGACIFYITGNASPLGGEVQSNMFQSTA